MNIDEITRIAELMTAHDLTEFLVESQDIKLSLKRHREAALPAPVMVAAAPVAAVPAAPVASAPVVAPAAPAAVPAAPEPRPGDANGVKCVTIDSPVVGTFYASGAPDAAPFVKIGDHVREDTTVCVVEAMKVMNEIKAEKNGVIRRILVENAKPVEFGQPLFEIAEE